jgi:hypothetical protein
VEEPIGMGGWLEMEKKLGLKGGKKEWIMPRRWMWVGWAHGMRRC